MSETDETASRARLRAHFLRSISSLTGTPVKVCMHENTNVSAIFRAADIDLEHIGVSELQTPIGKQAQAVLRTSDIIAVTFESLPEIQ